MYAYFEAAEQNYLKYMDLARSGQRPLSREHANPVWMAVGNETEFKHEGYMDFVDNRVDAGTGTLLGRAVFPNPDRFLVPGMFVRVRLLGTGKYKGPLINDRAIATDQDRRFVLVVGDDGRWNTAASRPARIVDGLRVVRDGLKPGEQIVVNGLQRVRPGMTVKPRDRADGRRSHRGRARGQRRPVERTDAVKFAHFFIDRPIFAAVISIVILLAGLIALQRLPISEYPEVAPPSVVVSRRVPGRESGGGRRDRRGAARAGGQRRRGHALHVLAVRPRPARCR